MRLETRRDQFCYFLGFVDRTRRSQLIEAEKKLIKAGFQQILTAEIFEFCPFNYTPEQLLRSYSIFESGSQHDFVLRLLGLLEEYLFLCSDFVPPCCDDGRTFYCHSLDAEIVLVCDRCGNAYTLNETRYENHQHKKITKPEFVALFDEDTAIDWPFHNKVRDLMRKTLSF